MWFFGLFGDKTHFNTLEEALGDGMNHINSLETRLSLNHHRVNIIILLSFFLISVDLLIIYK